MLRDLVMKNRGKWNLNDVLEIVGVIFMFIVIVVLGVAAMTIL